MSELEKSKMLKISASDKVYQDIREKLRATFTKYSYIPEVALCDKSCQELKSEAITKDGQVQYLLEVVLCMLQSVPNSPFMEELFNNFLKDYIHFVNPEHIYHLADYYLTDDFILKHKSEWHQDQSPKIRYI
ncbi:hypothetical protein [Adhaeribacter arboris]|nr:hypothetical protein [Adhaeribacter arboris]